MKLKLRLFTLLFCISIHSSPLHATIKIGAEFFFPPFVMSKSDGFDLGLMQTLCQHLQENCEFVFMNFHEIFNSLDQGKIDLAVGGIAITLDRLNKYIFSLPYKSSLGQFLISSKSKINSINDLSGQRVGVIRAEEEDGGLAHQYLVQNYNKTFDIIKYNTMEDLIAALSANEIAAAFLHHSTTSYWLENSVDKFRILGDKIKIGEGFGIMALPKNADLIQRLNQALKNMEKDNSYLNLYKTYFVNE